MIVNPQVPLHRLVLSLSEALDNVSPDLADHQLRVTYMSVRIARELGYRDAALRDIFHAAALHDIGLVRAENRARLIAHGNFEAVAWHGELGYELLRAGSFREHMSRNGWEDEYAPGACDFFLDAAEIVRHHHAVWDGGRRPGEVPDGAWIVALADAVDRSIRRDTLILQQNREILDRILADDGTVFAPHCVEAFRKVADAPAFWLDTVSKRVYSILARELDWPTIRIGEAEVESIARIFARLVDGLSPWTGTHSAGVAATAVALAKRLNFSPREQTLMRAAGYVHDIGKVTVPGRILDSPNKPTPEEWAILRAHTYHTFRILDSIGGLPQICEWAAFHHERLDGKGYPFGHAAADLVLGARIMAVTDTFTAVTEDRPYRKGMDDQQALDVLRKLVDGGAIDGEIVAVLRDDFDAVNDARRREQEAYGHKQRRLAELMEGLATETSCPL